MLRELSVRLARPVRAMLVAAVTFASAIAGCGGGVGVGGTGSFASGPITGFGSVIVNGIRFDDTGARIEAEDGSQLLRGNLGLGMIAEVEGGAVGGTSTDPTATATRIRIASALVGPVTARDAATQTLEVLQQPVRITPATVYAATLPDGFASITDADVLEVHGFFDAATATMVATRIEKRLLPPLVYKLRGVVEELDTAARTFEIGHATFSYASPLAPVEGRYVLLAVETAQVGGLWVVRRIDDGQRQLPDLDRAEIRGTVTAFTTTRLFSVNGQPVDASNAAFPDGEAVALGAQVEVRGALGAGTLRAAEVKLELEGGGSGEFRLFGTVTNLQTGVQTFVVQGQATSFTVDYSQAQFDDGATASDLADGRSVEVRADAVAGSAVLIARRIRLR